MVVRNLGGRREQEEQGTDPSVLLCGLEEEQLTVQIKIRLTEGEIKVVDSLGITEPKTKLLRDALKGFAPKRTVLIIVSPENKAVFMASSNMDRVKVADPRSLNVYDLLKYGNVIIEQGALETIEKHYNGSKK